MKPLDASIGGHDACMCAYDVWLLPKKNRNALNVYFFMYWLLFFPLQAKRKYSWCIIVFNIRFTNLYTPQPVGNCGFTVSI